MVAKASGQYIPFEATKAERIAAGDPRPSVQERYPSFAMYRAAVMNAIDNLVQEPVHALRGHRGGIRTAAAGRVGRGRTGAEWKSDAAGPGAVLQVER